MRKHSGIGGMELAADLRGENFHVSNEMEQCVGPLEYFVVVLYIRVCRTWVVIAGIRGE